LVGFDNFNRSARVSAIHLPENDLRRFNFVPNIDLDLFISFVNM